MKSIILHPHEIRRLTQKPVLVVRPISPQPPAGTVKAAYVAGSTCRKDEGAFTFLSADGPHGKSLMRKRCPLGQPGEVRFVKERWAINNVTLLPMYEAGGTEHGPWRHPGHMAEWQARYRVKIEEVCAMRCLELTQADANFALLNLRNDWDRRYGKRYPWATSWAWVVRASLVTRTTST